MPGEAQGLRAALSEAGREIPVQSLNQIGVKKVRVLKASNIESLVEDVVARMFDDREERIAREHNNRLEEEIRTKESLLAETDASSKRAEELAKELDNLNRDRDALKIELDERQKNWEAEKSDLLENTNRQVKEQIRELQNAKAQTDKVSEALRLSETAKGDLVDKLTAIATGHDAQTKELITQRQNIERQLKIALNEKAVSQSRLKQSQAGADELKDLLATETLSRESLVETVSALRVEIQDLGAALNLEKTTRETVIEDRNALRIEFKKLKSSSEAQVAEDTQVKSELQIKIDALQASSTVANTTIEEITKKINASEQDNRTTNELLNLANSRIDELLQHIELSETNFKTTKHDLELEQKNNHLLADQLADEQGENVHLQEKITDLNASIEADNTIRESLQAQRKDLEEELERRDEFEKKSAIERESLGKQVNELNDAIGSLEQEHIELGERHASFKLDHNRTVAELQQQIKEVHAEVITRDERLGAATATQAALTDDLENHKKQTVDLQNELNAQGLLLEASESLARHRLQELESLRRERQELDDQLMLLKTELSTLVSARNKLNNSVKELSDLRINLQNQVDEMNQRLEHLLKNVNSLESHRDELIEQLSAAESLNSNLGEQRDRMRQEFQELREKSGARESALTDEVNETLSKLETLTSELESSSDKNRTLNLEKAGVQLACDTARHDADTLRGKLHEVGEALHVEKEQRTTDRKTFEARLNTQENELHRISNERSLLDKELHKLKQLERLLQTQVTQLGKDLEMSSQDGEASRVQLEELRLEHQIQIDSGASLSSEVSRLRDEIALKEQQLGEHVQQLQERQSELARQTSRLSALRIERDNWQEQSLENTQINESLRLQLEREITNVEAMSQKQGILVDTCDQRATDLEQAELELESARSRVDMLSGRLETLEEEKTQFLETARRADDLAADLGMVRARNAEQERTIILLEEEAATHKRTLLDQNSGLKTLETASKQWERRCREYQSSWLEGKRNIEKLRHALANSEDTNSLLQSDLTDFETVQREHLIELKANDEELHNLRLERTQVDGELSILTKTINSLNAEIAQSRRALDQRESELGRQRDEVNAFRFRLEGLLAREIQDLLGPTDNSVSNEA